LLEDFYLVFVNSNLYANLFLKITHPEMLSWMAYVYKGFIQKQLDFVLALCFLPGSKVCTSSAPAPPRRLFNYDVESLLLLGRFCGIEHFCTP